MSRKQNSTIEIVKTIIALPVVALLSLFDGFN